MSIGDRTWQWAAHTAWGYPFNFLSNVIEHTFGYTYTYKKVSNATANAVLATTNGSSSKQTITSNLTNPDVPRVLTITIGGSGYSSDSIVINGTNVEGKPISDSLAYTSNGLVTGSLVFKRVTSVVIPSTSGASMTLTVGTSNELGLNHRLQPKFSTTVVIHDTVTGNTGAYPVTKPTVEAAPSSSNYDGEFVEKNWVVPASAPNGTWAIYFFYWFHKVLVYPPKDSPEFYSTTTSTSISTSSTSTSSTSVSTSTSVTTFSTSSTSSSTSSTSTSTTTLPV